MTVTGLTTAPTPPSPLDRLRARRELVHELLAEAGISKVGIFGSAARGAARPGIDLDLLIELPTPFDGLCYLSLLLALEDLLGCRVDLVPVDALPPLIRQTAEREAIPL